MKKHPTQQYQNQVPRTCKAIVTTGPGAGRSCGSLIHGSNTRYCGIHKNG